MGIGQISNCVPLYLSEASPAAVRGIVVGSWQLLLAIGQVIGACVDQGTKDIPSTASWRIPIGLNLFIPVLVFGLVWIIPESPRWLVSKKRSEKARHNLERINRGDPNYDSAQAVAIIEDDVRRSERDAANSGGWGAIFTDPVERRKLISTFGILAGQQIGGVQVCRRSHVTFRAAVTDHYIQFIFSYATVIATDLQLAQPFIITIIVSLSALCSHNCSPSARSILSKFSVSSLVS